MKRITSYIIILTILFVSCEDILDLEPTDTISGEHAITNENDLQKAILGCYDALQSDSYYGRMLLVVNEIGSDNAFHGGTILEYEQFYNNNIQEDNTFLSELWEAPYIAINRCNTAIYYTNKLDNLSNTRKDEYLAELYFLRALNYYNLTRLFKDIPLKLNPTFIDKNLNIPVTEQSLIYQQIIEDLEKANNKITNNDPIFATDLAVKTLLAKIYLELGNNADAIAFSDSVISSDRKLLDDYDKLYTTEYNSESIFELDYTELLTDKNRLAEYCYPKTLGGRYEIAPEDDLLNSFEQQDTMRKVFIEDPVYCNKYESITSGDDNIYIFRLAELYLLRAEARNLESGNIALILDDINTIRNRAGLDSIQTATHVDLVDIIDQERRAEFAFEGHRRFDLIRTGKIKEVLGITDDQIYYPIPLSETNTNTAINK